MEKIKSFAVPGMCEEMTFLHHIGGLGINI